MNSLPIEPNLKKLQEIFIFKYNKYKKVEFSEWEIKVLSNEYRKQHEVLNVFEQSDSLCFYVREMGTKKEPLFARYIFYKTADNYYFCARLNDEESIYDFIGVTQKFRDLFPVGDMSTKIFQTWKEPLKRFLTKRVKKGDTLTIKAF